MTIYSLDVLLFLFGTSLLFHVLTAGPSHVLPTAGTAKFFHGISAIDFFRRSSLLEYTQAALEAELDDIELFAQTEGLDAHGRSASIRRNAPTKKKASSK